MKLIDSKSNIEKINTYYHRTASRVGYRYFLGETKHFGWYEPGDSMWQFERAMRRMEARLAQRLHVPPGASVLDAGCGVGDVARTLAFRCGHRVTGIDILDFNLEKARERSSALGLSDRTTFMKGDYHELEFPGGAFDAVYTMETFVHSADPQKALGEFLRVLKPGGRLVMFEYSRAQDDEMPPEALRSLKEICDRAAMPAWEKLYYGELEKMLASSGFQVESSVNASAKMLPMLRAFSIMGQLPYAFTKKTGNTAKAVNVQSGVELYRYRRFWRYNIHTAIKTS